MTYVRTKDSAFTYLLAATLLIGTATAAFPDGGTRTVGVQSVARYSTKSTGAQANGFSKNPVFSPNGAKIVFESNASNLVSGDTNLRWDIFVKTLATGAITRVSTNASGVQANGDYSGQPSFSPDGTKVLFRSFATNLVPGGTVTMQVYIKNLTTGAVTRVSTSSSGVTANDFNYNPVWSHDGNKVAFESDASNLAPGDAGDLYRDVYVKNLVSGAVTRVSSSAAGKAGLGDSYNPAFSPNDAKVAFDSYARNLVTGDSNGYRDVFVKTLTGGAVQRVSTKADGAQGHLSAYGPAWSPDGTKVAFASGWPLVPGDGNNTYDVFIKTLSSGAIIRVSNNANGKGGNTESYNPSFSPNGNSIAFISYASNLVGGDTNNAEDIFVKDLTGQGIKRVSVTAAKTQANGRSWTEDASGKSYAPAFSPDSSKIVFPSAATNIVSGDTNGQPDVFVVKMTNF